MKHVLLPREEIHIRAVCDNQPLRLEAGRNWSKTSRAGVRRLYACYQEMLLTESIDAVFVFSAWENQMRRRTLFAMERKIPVAREVGGA